MSLASLEKTELVELCEFLIKQTADLEEFIKLLVYQKEQLSEGLTHLMEHYG